jgi:hypothetical protein
MRFLYLLATAAVGYALGAQATRRVIDEKFAELEGKLQGRGKGSPSAAPPAPPPAAAPAPKPAVAPPPAAPPVKEEITPETIAVISAALAAYLGKRAKIRSIRRVTHSGVSPWTQQGRVYIQGSHNLARQ